MVEEISILKKQMKQMEALVQIKTGERIQYEDVEMLMILQRRMQPSDLKEALQELLEVFTEETDEDSLLFGCGLPAFIKIKVLVDAGECMFNAQTKRVLLKEYEEQAKKLENIIQLSKISLASSDGYQQEKIQQTIWKNQVFADAVKKEQIRLKGELESKQLSGILKEKEPKEETRAVPKRSVKEQVSDVILRRQNLKQLEEELRMEQKHHAKTSCVEIPYYEKTLAFSKKYICKDMGAFVLLVRKNSIFFGLAKNAKKTRYDNRDESLLELTEAGMEFVRFMAKDLLKDGYEWEPLSAEEVRGMLQYFEFVSYCFTKHLGDTLTAGEYMEFQKYYNRLVAVYFSLEEKRIEEQIKAGFLAKKYTIYLSCYGMTEDDSEDEMVQKILVHNVTGYQERLDQIFQLHALEECAKRQIQALRDAFLMEEQTELKEANIKVPVEEMPVERTEEATKADIEPIHTPSGGKVFVRCESKDGGIADEALFSAGNLKLAVRDYLYRKAMKKTIGVYYGGHQIPIYICKYGGVSVLCPSDSRIGKVEKQIRDHYAEMMQEIMIQQTKGGNGSE